MIGLLDASIAFSPRSLAQCKGREGTRVLVAMLCSFYRRALHRNIKRGLPGCAYINNNCRANNKPEGSTLDSPKLLVPLPRAARFYCLLSSVRNGGSLLHRSRWRINDPAIRRRAANVRFSFSLSVSTSVLSACSYNVFPRTEASLTESFASS